jgi:hypothetical protein
LVEIGNSIYGPPQDDDQIITGLKPVEGQWEFNDSNITRIDPESGQTIWHNYSQHINRTPGWSIHRCLIETLDCNFNAQDNNNDTPTSWCTLFFRSRWWWGPLSRFYNIFTQSKDC